MAQAALIAETIAGMKRVVARYDDSSDTDEPYLLPTNRGNKLKRKAYHIQDGVPTGSRGVKRYKRSIEHAGYHRDILRRNPKRYDEDGDELSDDVTDEEADARAAEDNPYAEVRLEELLLPLTSAASLPNHPSLSVPYTSSTLTDMAQQACDMVRRERRTLSNAKQLLTKLRGDRTWIPCGLLYSVNDEAMFNTEKLYDIMASSKVPQYSNGSAIHNTVHSSLNSDLVLDRHSDFRRGRKPEEANGAIDGPHHDRAAASSVATNETITNSTLPPDSPSKQIGMEPGQNTKDARHNVEMTEPEDNHIAKQEPTSDHVGEAEKGSEPENVDISGPEVSMTGQEQLEDRKDQEMAIADGQPEANAPNTIPQPEHNHIQDISGPSEGAEPARTNHETLPDAEDGEADIEGDSDSRRAPRRMRTRAQAQAPPEPTPLSRNPSPDSWTAPEIHPLFLLPSAAIPDKDFGLPPSEAEETRRMLMMYVQKQEEVCRGAEKLYDGLLKADAQRKTVYKWCKAEGHVGEMSDGEDWYDKEEWGLEEELRKGHNDEDEDNVIQGKKTRGRRA